MAEYVRDLRRRDRLGSRLMATTLLLACTIGIVLNIGQIFADSRSQSAELDRVVDRPFRFVTAAMFGDVRDYRIPLTTEKGEEVGSLHLRLDTYPPGRAFLLRAAVTLGLGMLKAALLALVLLYVFNRFLTRPLVKMAHQLTSFDPNAPEAIHVAVPERHEKDELGLWARAVNRLLGAIRDNQARRTEAETRASWLEHFDTLTGLANRTLLLANTTHAIAGAGPELHLAILILDIREFRDVNAQ